MRLSLLVIFCMLSLRGSGQPLDPKPVEPLPSPGQLAWHELEFYGFLHFSINTFTGKEWGYGDESPGLFNPTDFDADEIVRIAADAGMKGLILTCKHHDGFCLWPSAYTDYSVRNSPWKGGGGDVVREISDACRTHGLKFGVYLSPWDRNHAHYGGREYIRYYRQQLRELLTNYGEIFEVWFDGANGGDGFYGGAREERRIDRNSYYGWDSVWAMVRELQPGAMIFSDVGPDVRWVGNEQGFAGETCWAPYTPVGEDGGPASPGNVRSAEGLEGHSDGKGWIPAECDVSIRPGWFYRPGEDGDVKTPRRLFDLYLRNVGRNASFLLNVPPDRRGRFHPADAQALLAFGEEIRMTFSKDLAVGATTVPSNTRGGAESYSAVNLFDADPQTYWGMDDSVEEASVVVTLQEPVSFNCIMMQEPLALGQRIEKFVLEEWRGDQWVSVARGTTVGHKRLILFPPVASPKVRLNVRSRQGPPLLSTFGIYRIPDAAPEERR